MNAAPGRIVAAQELFRSDHLLVRRVGGFGGTLCYLTFASYTDDRTLDRPGFGEDFFRGRGIDAIHVLSRENRWYQHPELMDALAAVAGATGGYPRVIAYGSSMGGFAALHLGNPNATPLSIAALGIEGGIMLGAVYVATRSLWWTFGVHAAWNFTQSGLFGIADSGHQGQGLLRTELAGPAWLTGGAFGIEASVVSVVLCAVVAGAFLIHAWRRERFVPSFWKKRHAV